MGKRGPKPRTVGGVEDLDGLDHQIIALRDDNAAITIDEIAQRTGKDRSTIRRRLRLLRSSGFVEYAVAELEALLPKAVNAVDEGLDNDDLSNRPRVGLEVLKGFGVLKDHKKIELDLTNIDVVREIFRQIPEEVLIQLEAEEAEYEVVDG